MSDKYFEQKLQRKFKHILHSKQSSANLTVFEITEEKRAVAPELLRCAYISEHVSLLYVHLKIALMHILRFPKSLQFIKFLNKNVTCILHCAACRGPSEPSSFWSFRDYKWVQMTPAVDSANTYTSTEYIHVLYQQHMSKRVTFKWKIEVSGVKIPTCKRQNS
jgi:hypothetical protein